MTPPHVLDHALFDLLDDPAETTDVAERFPGVGAELDRELVRFRRQHEEWTPFRGRNVAMVDSRHL